jgi:hypothetical protein
MPVADVGKPDSEKILGELHAADSFKIHTKAPGYAPGMFSHENILKSAEESLKLLKTESVCVNLIISLNLLTSVLLGRNLPLASARNHDTDCGYSRRYSRALQSWEDQACKSNFKLFMKGKLILLLVWPVKFLASASAGSLRCSQGKRLSSSNRLPRQLHCRIQED